jgi:phage shock protein B
MEPLLAIFALFIFIPLVICITIVILVGIKKEKRATSASSTEDAQAMRTLFADQERLARRIEALETILIETYRQKQTPPPVPQSERDRLLDREAQMVSPVSSEHREPFS